MVELAHWARRRYLQAGLTLPHVELLFHDDREACAGKAGRAVTVENGYRLDLCSTRPTNYTKKLVLHELAHAWVDRNITVEQRQDFMELRGVDVWNDHTYDWWTRGTEHAAEILAWGLGEVSRRPRLLPDTDLDSLNTAYEWLTGTAPLCDTSHEWRPGQAGAESQPPGQPMSSTITVTHRASAQQPHRLEP